MKAWLFQDSRQKQKLGAEKCPWSVGWLDPDGRRRSKRVGAKSMAEKFRLKKETELEHGIASPRSVTWAEFRRKYDEAILAGMSEGNRNQTEIALKHFERIIKPKRMAAIATATTDLYRNKRSKEQGRTEKTTVSVSTVNKELRHLRAVFNVAADWELIAKAPKVRMLREPERDPDFIDDEKFAALYKACDKMTQPGGQHYTAEEWWQGLLVFAYMTGWRIRQILAIEWANVDLEAGVVRVAAEHTKGRRDARVELNGAVIEHLEPLRGFDSHVFRWPLNERGLWEHFAKLKGHAGVDIPGAFHRLRFGFCNANDGVFDEGVLQQLMLHKSASTTRRYINQAHRMRRQGTAERLHVPDVLKKTAN